MLSANKPTKISNHSTMLLKLRTDYSRETKHNSEFELALSIWNEFIKDDIKFQIIKNGFIKIFTEEKFKNYFKISTTVEDRGFEFTYKQNIEKINNANNFNEIIAPIQDLLFIFGGGQYDDKDCQLYYELRKHAKQVKANDCCDAMFKGTTSRTYINGFSMHSYKFAHYLNLHYCDDLSTTELKSIIEFFYLFYIVNQFHSFCEVDAAFLRASENFKYNALDLVKFPKTNLDICVGSIVRKLDEKKKIDEKVLTAKKETSEKKQTAIIDTKNNQEKSEVNLKNKLKAYIKRIENHVTKDKKIDFTYGFWFFKNSRALNREANYHLARRFLDQLENKQTVETVFKNSLIQRNTIIDNKKLFFRPEFTDRGINSDELKIVIEEAKRIIGDIR